MKRIVLSLVILGLVGFGFWFFLGRDPDHGLRVHAPRNVVWLDSGLNEEETRAWHHTSEGSEMLPFSVLLVLKSVRTGRPFVESLQDYGFLIESDNPMDVPVGWSTAEVQVGLRKTPMIGLNCAACHTGELRYRGTVLRINGAPNLFSLEDFFNDLRASLDPILDDPVKAFVFVRDLIRETHRPTEDGELLEVSPEAAGSLASVDTKDGLDARESAIVNLVGGGFIRAAHGEPVVADTNPISEVSTDAVRLAGEVVDSIVRDSSLLSRRLQTFRILAKAIDAGTPLGPGRGDSFGIIRDLLFPDDPVTLDAPVSTPPLFGFAGFQWLHWDGNTRDVLGRNIAQAVALGADFDPATYRSSVNLTGIDLLESLGRKLKAPAWPAQVFGKLDEGRVAEGKALFATHCASCHTSEAVHPVGGIGTEPRRALSLGAPLRGRPFADALTAFGVRASQVALEQSGLGPDAAERLGRGQPKDWRATGGYIARSLAGIWASPPYLHNGSVPTLHDLLLPASKRPGRFPVGHREFDPVKVGFTTDASDAPFILDTTVDGNGNQGHEFGTGLSEPERMALVEYMKSL